MLKGRAEQLKGKEDVLFQKLVKDEELCLADIEVLRKRMDEDMKWFINNPFWGMVMKRMLKEVEEYHILKEVG